MLEILFMDTAKKFKPETILLWKKVQTHPEAQRILALFPSANVHIIEQQRSTSPSNMSPGKAMLRGKRILMIGQTSSFVGHFDGRPGPGVCCLPYYKLVPVSNGCPYYCTYCYLAFVYRKHSPYIKININYETLFKQVRKVLAGSRQNVAFNMGEMLDSLALDHITKLTRILIPFFSDFSRAYLMLLTKSSNIDNLLAIEPNNQTVVSWSLNSRHVIATFESGTAGLEERLQAARLCQNHGYRIRFRIDPGIPHLHWQTEYADLIERALTLTRPENMTLGMLRLLPGHLRLAAEAYGKRANKLRQYNLLKGAADGKLRFMPKQRVDFYSFLIDTIRSFDKDISISLCRETPDIWNALKSRCEFKKCNCAVW